jgi:CSLREA domain-containing protein
VAVAAACAGSGVAVCAASSPAHAGTTITVNTTADDNGGPIGKCTLRDAINAANTDKSVDTCPAGSGADTIIVPAGTYTAMSGETLPEITTTMTIVGSGPSTLVHPGGGVIVSNSGVLTISAMTLDGGWLGIENLGGTLNVANMTLRNMSGADGAIRNDGTLTLVMSTLTQNRGWSGGAILNDRGSVIAVNDTFTNNTGQWPVGPGTSGPIGGAFQNRNGGTFRGRNLTITNNTAIGDGSYNTGQTGGVMDEGGTVELANSIVAGNKLLKDPGGAPDCASYGQFRSLGDNLIGSTKGCTLSGSLKGDITGTAPKLGALANNGGPTQTMMPLPGSPAIDKGNPAAPGQLPALCPLLDQRGVARPRDGNHDGIKRCDIGAVER